jgi:hypothetical protein
VGSGARVDARGEWLEVPGGSVMQQSTLEDDRQLGCRGLGG